MTVFHPTTVATTHLSVVGMSCEHCARAVATEVRQVPHVREAVVDLASGRLTVTSDSTVDLRAVADAVAEAGCRLG
ncbi:MAG TPA: heavy metal-associated domain-containing protein [Propionibacteriaceae bacterium]|jgi:copper chaperone CopZ